MSYESVSIHDSGRFNLLSICIVADDDGDGRIDEDIALQRCVYIFILQSIFFRWFTQTTFILRYNYLVSHSGTQQTHDVGTMLG